jgi:uncharacterized membrane protein
MEELILPVISRWIHVGTAIVLVGGTVFMRYFVMPAAVQLPEAEHEALRQRILGRWKKAVHAGIALLLLSGFYNYIVVTLPAHRGDRLYHPLIGIKILLALAIFFLASALVGRSRAFDGLRKNAKTWLSVIVLLATIIVGISGYLKVRPFEPPAAHVQESR